MGILNGSRQIIIDEGQAWVDVVRGHNIMSLENEIVQLGEVLKVGRFEQWGLW